MRKQVESAMQADNLQIDTNEDITLADFDLFFQNFIDPQKIK